KRAYCLKTQPATGETYPKSDLFNKAKHCLFSKTVNEVPRTGKRSNLINFPFCLDLKKTMLLYWL
ncbi:hypothetical protein ACRFDH_26410, partial [Klebsiella pneumoniae]